MGGRHQAPSPQVSLKESNLQLPSLRPPPCPLQIFGSSDASEFNSLRLDQDLPAASHLRADASGHIHTAPEA